MACEFFERNKSMSNEYKTTAAVPAGLNREALAVDAIALLAQKANEPIYREYDGLPVVQLPGVGSPVSLEKFLRVPRRARATVAMMDVKSLAEYVLRYAGEGTVIFGTADERGGGFCAVLDYHRGVSADGAPLAGWAEHRAELKLRVTPEWERWLSRASKDLMQREFAEFLEDNAADIVVPESCSTAPNSAVMLDVALTLQAKSEVQFSSAQRLQNGQTQLTYNEQITAQAGAEGKLQVPARFYLSVPPFVGAERYLVGARLRYRVTGGKLTFKYELERPHKVVEAALADLRAAVEKLTGRNVIMGAVQSVNAGI